MMTKKKRGAPAHKREALKEKLRSDNRSVISLATDRPWLEEITAHPSQLLEDMARKGWAHRIQSGRYLVEVDAASPQALPLVDELEPLVEAVLAGLGVPYYLSWHTALFHYGLVEQQSSTIFCGVPRRKTPVRFGRFAIRFVYSPAPAIFGNEPSIEFQQSVIFASPERALLDSLQRPDLAAPYPVLLAAFESAVQQKMLDPRRLVAYTVRLGSAALARRVGFLMDHYGLQGSEPLLDYIGARRRLEAFKPGDSRESGEAEPKWRLRIPPRLILTAENLK
jgi:predicted transcriptional regulator of viral defense system